MALLFHWRDHFSPDDGATWADRMLDQGYIGEEAHAIALAEIDAYGRVRSHAAVLQAKAARRARQVSPSRPELSPMVVFAHTLNRQYARAIGAL